MPNVFDQFDQQQAPAQQNAFDQFDQPSAAPGQAPIQPEQPRAWSDVPGEALSNFAPSGAKYIRDIAQVFLHPIDTIKGIDMVTKGLLRKITPAVNALDPVESVKRTGIAIENLYNKFIGGGKPVPYKTTKEEKTSDAVIEFYKNRYGGEENLKKTIAEDPVGFVADLATVLTIVGGSMTKLGQLGNLEKITKTGQTLSKTGQAIEPLRLMSKTVGTPLRHAYEYGFGQTTGGGKKVIHEALKGTQDFTDAMKGKLSETDVLGNYRRALTRMREARGTKYRAQLAELRTANKSLNIAPIRRMTQSWLRRFNVKTTPEGLDFSRSTLSRSSQGHIQEVFDMVMDWGARKGDRTPVGLDILKRKLDDFHSSAWRSGGLSNQADAMVTSLSKSLKKTITREVPAYKAMLKDYASSTDMIKDVDRALSLGTKKSADTALRKILTALREEKTFRRSLIDELAKYSDVDLMAQGSGLLSRSAWSTRLGSQAVSSVGLLGMIFGRPEMVALLAAGSPRLIGEITYRLGKLTRAAGKLPPKARLGAAQLGRLQEQ